MTITGELSEWILDYPVSTRLSIVGGSGNYTSVQIISGSLPPGISVELVGAEIKFIGSPTSADTTEATISVVDDRGSYGERLLVCKTTMRLWTLDDLTNEPNLLLDWNSSVTETSSNSGYIERWWNSGADGSFLESVNTDLPIIQNDVTFPKRYVKFNGTTHYLFSNDSTIRSILSGAEFGWAMAIYKPNVLDTVVTERPIFWYPRTDTTSSRFGLLWSRGSTKNTPVIGGRRLNSDSFGACGHTEEMDASWIIHYGELDFLNNSARIIVNGIESEKTDIWPSGGTAQSGRAAMLCVARTSGGGSYSDVSIAGIIFSNERIAEAEINKIFGWAAHQCDLVDKLPLGHEYKDHPPVVPLP